MALIAELPGLEGTWKHAGINRVSSFDRRATLGVLCCDADLVLCLGIVYIVAAGTFSREMYWSRDPLSKGTGCPRAGVWNSKGNALLTELLRATGF